MASKFAYDYYEIEIDPEEESDSEARLTLAVERARDTARIYAMPCLWYPVSDDGHTLRICRKRHKKENKE